MYTIKKTSSPELAALCCVPWSEFPGGPETFVSISLTEKAFKVTFKVYESDPTAVYTEHFSPVFLDSCVEWFVQFCPKTCCRYFNFELNSLGAMDVSFRYSEEEFSAVCPTDLEAFDINIQKLADFWQASYVIPFAFIKKYIPEFDIKTCDIIKTNAYKCGDRTALPHYRTLFDIHTSKPNFHQPDFFGEMLVKF